MLGWSPGTHLKMVGGGTRRLGWAEESPWAAGVLGCATEHWDGAREYQDVRQEHPWATGTLGCTSDSMEWATGTLAWGTGTLGCAAGILGWGTRTSLGYRNVEMGLRKVRMGSRNIGLHYRIIPGNVRVPFSQSLGSCSREKQGPRECFGLEKPLPGCSFLRHLPGQAGLLRVGALGIARGVLAAPLHPGVLLGRRRRHHLGLLLPGLGGR